MMKEPEVLGEINNENEAIIGNLIIWVRFSYPVVVSFD